jgi:hypothetical protein
MFPDEVEMIHQPHRYLQPWMRPGAGKQCGILLLHSIHQLQTCLSKLD